MAMMMVSLAAIARSVKPSHAAPARSAPAIAAVAFIAIFELNLRMIFPPGIFSWGFQAVAPLGEYHHVELEGVNAGTSHSHPTFRRIAVPSRGRPPAGPK